jgi:inner membrane protein
MASPLGHTAVALALAVALRPAGAPRRYWVLGACCAVLPDLDFLARQLGARRLDMLLGGHRGLTHSIPFALGLGLLVVLLAFGGPEWNRRRGRLWLYFAAATASHGLVDCLTAYGSGVALLAPISWARVKAPWRPLGRGPCGGDLDCLAQGVGGELLWLVVPALIVAATCVWWRRRAGGRGGPAEA